MKKFVFRNGIYTVLRPLYYLCKVFGLAPYSYVADRRNKRATADYGYWNYIFTVIWLTVFTVGFPVQILALKSTDFNRDTLFIAFKIYMISSYTSSIVVVVWVSVIKRRKFLEILENVSEVDNKIRYTHQEETSMNRKMMFNVISQIILLTVIQCSLTTYIIYIMASEPYYIIIIQTMIGVPDFCNALILFKFVTLVSIVKQRYSHLNKRLNNWISGAVSLNKANVRCRQFDRTVDQVNITRLFVSSVGNIEGTLKKTDIHLLRQIYSELYDITCLINDTYGIPVLAATCWMLTGVVYSLYETLISFEIWGVSDVLYAITYSIFFFKVTLICHKATNEARSSSILVQKILLMGNCRNECIEELKMFSLQLQVMTNEYTASGFFSLNLSFFASVYSVIVSYIVILVQIK